MENEIFRDVVGYEGLYKISNYGRVYGIKRNNFLKYGVDKNGYYQIILCKDGKRKTCKVHRIVANAFIPNPLQLPQVNHRDENPSNNHVENLEFCDAKYNVNYGTRTERAISKMIVHPNWAKSIENFSKTVLQFTKDGEFVAEYPSASEASRRTKIANQSISSCCLGKRKSAGKYVWKFKDAS